ncbi:MAG: hypothetical protein ACTHMS_03180 [Jatrophihabitans sp.]|uniref:hypothetical protein n=1 Tax=Jatrophihabitans sp. TaxID=1932789 RepID=UPI003F81BF43
MTAADDSSPAKMRRTGNIGHQVALAYERLRGATVLDVSDRYPEVVRRALDEVGGRECWGLSCDLVSRTSSEVRLIEVKSRSLSGPVPGLKDRQRDTLLAAGPAGWLYVVWNTREPARIELRVFADAGNLPWQKVGARPAATALGDIRSEAEYQLDYDFVRERGVQVDLDGLDFGGF